MLLGIMGIIILFVWNTNPRLFMGLFIGQSLTYKSEANETKIKSQHLPSCMYECDSSDSAVWELWKSEQPDICTMVSTATKLTWLLQYQKNRRIFIWFQTFYIFSHWFTKLHLEVFRYCFYNLFSFGVNFIYYLNVYIQLNKRFFT